MAQGTEPMRVVLPNGCVVIAQQLKGSPLISLHGFVTGGTLWEAPEKAGSVSLMAQTLRRGTEKRSAWEIDEFLESCGAELRFSASHEGVTMQMSCLPDDYTECVALLTEILRQPTFPEEEVEKQKVRVVNALRDALTRPEEVSYRRFLALAYPPHHPLHRAPDGTPESVEDLAREDLVAVYSKALHPARTILAVVGDMLPQQLLEPFTTLLSDWVTNSPADAEFPSVSLPEKSQRERVALPDKLQAWVVMGHKGVRRTDASFYAANVMATILGAGWGRLFTEIRDNRGLAYVVGASLQSGLMEGPFVIRMGVNPKDIDHAIETALTELERIRREPPTEDEVADAKNYLLGRLVLSMETTAGFASMLVTCELYGLGLDYPKRAKDLYDPITKERVREVAEALLHPERMAIAIAGP